MARVTIYLPDKIARQLRGEARRRRVSLSAYVATLAKAKLRPVRSPETFIALYGSWQGTFPEAHDAPPDPGSTPDQP